MDSFNCGRIYNFWIHEDQRMISYFANYMGPINKKWIEDHGDCWMGGRIDISGVKC